MTELNVKGTGVALVTPFDANGKIDFSSLGKMVNNVIDGGVNYIIALGTTAETPALSKDEQEEVTQSIISYTNGRVPVIVGMGGNNTLALVEKIKNYSFKGVDGILSVAPYYNKPTQEGIYQHFKSIAEVSPVPVILYNVPGRTASNISAETCVRLARDFSNIIAVKEASGDLNQIMTIIKDKPDGFHVLSGDDAMTFSMISLGASGVISVVSNAFPAEFSKMVSLCLQNNFEEARKIHYALLPIINHAFAEGNPAGIKGYLKIKGLIEKYVRLPLVEASESLMKKIQESSDL